MFCCYPLQPSAGQRKLAAQSCAQLFKSWLMLAQKIGIDFFDTTSLIMCWCMCCGVWWIKELSDRIHTPLLHTIPNANVCCWYVHVHYMYLNCSICISLNQNCGTRLFIVICQNVPNFRRQWCVMSCHFPVSYFYSDENEFSLYIITTCSKIQVIRIK